MFSKCPVSVSEVSSSHFGIKYFRNFLILYIFIHSCIFSRFVHLSEGHKGINTELSYRLVHSPNGIYIRGWSTFKYRSQQCCPSLPRDWQEARQARHLAVTSQVREKGWDWEQYSWNWNLHSQIWCKLLK